MKGITTFIAFSVITENFLRQFIQKYINVILSKMGLSAVFHESSIMKSIYISDPTFNVKEFLINGLLLLMDICFDLSADLPDVPYCLSSVSVSHVSHPE